MSTPELSAEDKAENMTARRKAASQVDQAGRGLSIAMKELLTAQETTPTLKVIGILSTVQAYIADATCLLAQRMEEAAGTPQGQAPEAPRIVVPGGGSGKLLVPR